MTLFLPHRNARLLRTLITANALAIAMVAPACAALSHPWLSVSPRFEKYAYFSNVRSGDEVTSPFVVKFGVSGMGVAAIDTAVENTGHHHLLIDRPLPLDFSKPLPSNDQYIHFGKGQLEFLVNLPPGEHELRLVFADHRHIPNFVYSKPLRIRVREGKSASAQTAPTEGIEVLTPREGESVRPPFRISLHASGWKISHHLIKNPSTGHFRLTLRSGTGQSARFDLDEGQTELWFAPPAGDDSAELELIDNSDPKRVLATSEKRSFTVVAN